MIHVLHIPRPRALLHPVAHAPPTQGPYPEELAEPPCSITTRASPHTNSLAGVGRGTQVPWLPLKRRQQQVLSLYGSEEINYHVSNLSTETYPGQFGGGSGVSPDRHTAQRQDKGREGDRESHLNHGEQSSPHIPLWLT